MKFELEIVKDDVIVGEESGANLERAQAIINELAEKGIKADRVEFEVTQQDEPPCGNGLNTVVFLRNGLEMANASGVSVERGFELIAAAIELNLYFTEIAWLLNKPDTGEATE